MNRKYVEINKEFIVNLRNKLKLSQQDFAVLVGVSYRTITNWEKGITSPIESVKKLLLLLDNKPKRNSKVINKVFFIKNNVLKRCLINNPDLF